MKKEKGLVLKKYEMDWDFIISNYLNPELWEKKWTLFQYKEWVITIKLNSIECQDNKISFLLEIKDNSTERKYKDAWGSHNRDKTLWSFINYSLKIDDIQFLIKKIQNGIWDLINRIEQENIRALEIYEQIKSSANHEKRELERIAENFLDDEGVTNEEIRDVYIENYVENNQKIKDKLDEILYENEYTIFTDFYLVYAESTKDEKMIERAKNKTKKVADIESIQEEVEKYMQKIETEEFEDEMRDNLEEI